MWSGVGLQVDVTGLQVDVAVATGSCAHFRKVNIIIECAVSKSVENEFFQFANVVRSWWVCKVVRTLWRWILSRK